MNIHLLYGIASLNCAVLTFMSPPGLGSQMEDPSHGNSYNSPNPVLQVKAPNRYTVTDLGTLGGYGSEGYGINSHGQIVGVSDLPLRGSYYPSHAYVTNDQAMTDLGTLGGSESVAYGINDLGQVVGESRTLENTQIHAFVTIGGVMTDLGTLGGAYSKGYDINDYGQVVGLSQTPDGREHAFVTIGGVMTDLGLGDARGINASGQVAGSSYIPSIRASHAFVTIGRVITDLGTLGGTHSYATGVNDNGQVVGLSQTPDGTTHAFVTISGVMTDLGTISGMKDSVGLGINASGQVVGYAFTSTSGKWTEHAIVTIRGVLTDLNSLIELGSGWSLERAWAINNLGQITGTGVNPSGQTHVFLASPELLPLIKANQSAGPITIAATDTLSIAVQLTAAGRENADWWLVARTPSGDWYYYVHPHQWIEAGSVLGNVSFAHQGPLFNLNPFQALSVTNLQPGTYRFYFGVDLNMNGLLDMDQIHYDSVEVIVR